MNTSKGRAQSAREPHYQDRPTAADSAVGTTVTMDELREAAGKVTCWRCEGYGELKSPYEEGAGMDDAEPCPDCADLRARLAEVTK